MPEDHDESEILEFVSVSTDSPRKRSLFHEEEIEIREWLLRNDKLEISPEYTPLIEDILRMRRIKDEEPHIKRDLAREYLEARRQARQRRTVRRRPVRPIPPPDFTTRK